ncbi:hypothetical protein JQC92_04950 [Shewanella sp. 202IG2-18]|uniref:hypothetical protein n=1 Tax=Parashewanella hymeniacidonis TaxID=2807618 RepID=UPI00195F6BBC|nr:hypothetical protein [Parashewanella hymeniacidonis]MBM7071388.1 hypothetical protein [Parashewanella hymeniacidonis]
MEHNKPLFAATILTVIAALAHIACIAVGGDAYRFLGAGEQLAQMAEQGHWYPTFITLIITGVLCLFAAYAASGAGLLPRLPLLKLGLVVISSVFLLRALGFVFIMPMFPENSVTFWLQQISVNLVSLSLYVNYLI